MKYLLDTHAILWFFDHVEKLPETVLKAILDPANRKYVSIVSAWELPIKEEHIKQVEYLPFLHRDPFDRMLIASAISEGMSLITADDNIQRYNVQWVW